MDITKARDELIREAADKLVIVGTGQPLDADYFERINNAVDPMFAQLRVDSVCVVDNDALIPSEWFDALAGLLANICAPMAGKGFDPQIKMFYEMQLKRMNAFKPGFNVQEAEYF